MVIGCAGLVYQRLLLVVEVATYVTITLAKSLELGTKVKLSKQSIERKMLFHFGAEL